MTTVRDPEVRARAVPPPRRMRDAAATVDAIRWIVRLLRLSGARTIAGSGLSPAQLFVLQRLRDGEGASLTELGARTMTDRTSVAAVVDRLEARGLVTREVAAHDRRRAAVRVTAEGLEVLASAPPAPTVELIEALGGFDDDALSELARGVTRLADALGAGAERPPMLFADEPDGAPSGLRRERGAPRTLLRATAGERDSRRPRHGGARARGRA